MNALPRNRIVKGDALTVLRSLPDHEVDTIVTSPPYFRLRDYEVEGQLGLEENVDEWATNLRTVLQECARVLVPTGTVWLNVGDAYSTHRREGAERKSLLLGPERLVLALIADGWTIRNKIIWAKTTTVPTSVRDRFATKHELIYLLTRSTDYYFDLDAVRQPHISRPPKPRARTGPGRQRPSWLGPNSDSDLGLAALHAAGLRGHPLGKNPGDVWSLGVSNFRARTSRRTRRSWSSACCWPGVLSAAAARAFAHGDIPSNAGVTTPSDLPPERAVTAEHPANRASCSIPLSGQARPPWPPARSTGTGWVSS